MEPVAQWLRARGASNELVEWAQPFAADFARLWSECPRGDWLLALAVRLAADRRALVLAATRCARCSLLSLTEDEARPEAALDVAEAWARGQADPARIAEQRELLAAALAAADDPGSGAAVIAASAALEAIEQPEAAVNAAAFAVQAAVLEAGECAMLEALRFAQYETAECVRATIASSDAARWWQERPAANG
jgi:hypothetical protein